MTITPQHTLPDAPNEDAEAGRPALPADAAARLDALRHNVERELAITGYPKRAWLPQQTGVLDVLIVGAGQAGLSAAYGLARRDVTNVEIVDGAPAGQEGPWSTTARMVTLRTPKTLKGPEGEVPSMSPQSWFEARYGLNIWDTIPQIPRLDWQEYLAFYREMTGATVRSGVTVHTVTPPSDADGPFTVVLDGPEGRETRLTRRVVFATGLEGAGGINVPAHLFGHLPRSAWAHTNEHIDFTSLAGKRVGVLGGGASAFDNAASALEAGAASVDSFMRRAAMPSSNPLRWMEFGAFVEHYADWTDAQKWAFTHRVLEVDQPTTQSSLWRCYAHTNFSLSFSSPWLSTRMDGDEVVVDIAGTEHRFDFLIAGTGVSVDLTLRPELAEVVDAIATWSDRYQPPAGLESRALGGYPYLDGSFGFTPKPGVDAPWVSRLHHFAQGARVTMGITGHQLSGLPAGTQRLVWGIVRDEFTRHSADILADFFGYNAPEVVDIGPRPEGIAPLPHYTSAAQLG